MAVVAVSDVIFGCKVKVPCPIIPWIRSDNRFAFTPCSCGSTIVAANVGAFGFASASACSKAVQLAR